MTTLYTLMTMDELLAAGETEGGLAAVIASRAAAEVHAADERVAEAVRDAEFTQDEAGRQVAAALDLLRTIAIDALPEEQADALVEAIERLEG